MSALAARFPGALREIDEVPMDALEERVRELRDVVSGSHPRDDHWGPALHRFHELFRGVLFAKRWLGEQRDRTAFEDDAERAGVPEAVTWRDDLDAIASPPGGKLGPLVIARIARELSLPADRVWSMVHPFARVRR
jgi:hypothetical protein